MAREVVLTPEGKERLEQDLDRLRGRGRREIAERLEHALAMGRELAENAEYLAAKEEQERLERRIAALQSRLERSSIAIRGAADGAVAVGAHVRIREHGSRTTEEYDIAGSGDGDPSAGRISLDSPIGRALLGHREGEQVDVDTPVGVRRVMILAVR